MVVSRDWDGEVVAVVNRRADLMAALRSPRDKRDLLEELDVSRSTLDRSIRELETLGLVTRSDGYRLTATGRLAFELFDGFLGDLQDVVGAEELLRTLPPDAPLSPALLRGATVTVAEPPSPVRAIDPVDEVVAEADRLKGLSVAATRPESVIEDFESRVEAGATFEWVLTDEMAAYIREEHAGAVGRLRETGRFELYRIDDVPYGLVLVTADDRRHTCVIVYDDDHTLRGAIVNDGLEAYSWAEHVYETYRADAEPLDPL